MLGQLFFRDIHLLALDAIQLLALLLAQPDPVHQGPARLQSSLDAARRPTRNGQRGGATRPLGRVHGRELLLLLRRGKTHLWVHASYANLQ